MISPPDRPQQNPGFTLFEVLIVLAVLGLVFGVIITRGPVKSRGLTVRAAATDIAAAAREARARAIALNRPVMLSFDLKTGLYRVANRTPQAIPPGYTISVLTVAGEVRGSLAAIRFDPDGSSTGGRIELSNPTQKVQIGVDFLTGRVSIADAS